MTPICNASQPAGVPCGATKVGGVAFDPTPFIVGYLANNPNAQYITAGQGALTNAGRNTIPTQRINNIDLNLLKRFAITERTRFEFGAQLFNIFNHPQYVPGSINDVRSIGQAGTAVLNYLKPSSGTFQDAKDTFPSQSRAIQLSLKLIF